MTPMKKLVAALLAYAMLWTSVLPAQAGWYSGCGPCCPPQPCYQTVQKTVMVPSWETQTQTIQVSRCRPEVRQMTYNCYRNVPVMKQVQQQCTVMVPQVQQKTISYTVCRQEMREYTRQCTVMVPVQETRTCMRQVCQMVPQTMTHTVCVDQGHWETVSCGGAPSGAPEMSNPPANNAPPAMPAPALPSPSERPAAPAPQAKQAGKIPVMQVSFRRNMMQYGGGCCSPCAPSCCVQRVWVPQIVQKQVSYTCMKPQISQVPCNYTVTVCHPEVRTYKVQCPVMVPEQQTKTINCTVYVPQVQTRTYNVCNYQCVAEKRTVNCTVMVPYTENQQIQVQVCKMVPKTITCQVPICCM
jgi:hypothetical protein